MCMRGLCRRRSGSQRYSLQISYQEMLGQFVRDGFVGLPDQWVGIGIVGRGFGQSRFLVYEILAVICFPLHRLLRLDWTYLLYGRLVHRLRYGYQMYWAYLDVSCTFELLGEIYVKFLFPLHEILLLLGNCSVEIRIYVG